MEKVCPMCNELDEKVFECEKCGGIMIDDGIVQEYLGDYMENMEIQDGENLCVHVLKCNNCGFYEKKFIKKIII